MGDVADDRPICIVLVELGGVRADVQAGGPVGYDLAVEIEGGHVRRTPDEQDGVDIEECLTRGRIDGEK